MRDYRAYILGIDGHRFIKAAGFLSDHPDDATALAAAKQLIDGHDVELGSWTAKLRRSSRTQDKRPNLKSGRAAS